MLISSSLTYLLVSGCSSATEPRGLSGTFLLTTFNEQPLPADAGSLPSPEGQPLLELEGYRVIPARNAAEALDRLVETPDLLIVDADLPDVEGFKVAAMIRMKLVCPVLLTTVEDQRYLHREAVSAVLRKPYDIRQLLKTVAALLP